MDISCSLFFILWTLLSFIVINCAIWSTDHKVVINLSWRFFNLFRFVWSKVWKICTRINAARCAVSDSRPSGRYNYEVPSRCMSPPFLWPVRQRFQWYRYILSILQVYHWVMVPKTRLFTFLRFIWSKLWSLHINPFTADPVRTILCHTGLTHHF